MRGGRDSQDKYDVQKGKGISENHIIADKGREGSKILKIIRTSYVHCHQGCGLSLKPIWQATGIVAPSAVGSSMHG